MSVKIMTRVWEQSKQKGTGLIALLAIADHADDYGVCWPGLDLIAKKARIKKRQVINVIEKLEASEELIVIHNRGRHVSNRYLVTVGLSSEEIEETLGTHPELQTDSKKGVEDCTISLSTRKKVQKNTPFGGEKKVQSSTKKVQSSAKKGAIAIAPESSCNHVNHQLKEEVEINFNLPPHPHSDLQGKKVYWKSNDTLQPSIVTKVMAKTLAFTIIETGEQRRCKPDGQIFCLNGGPGLSPVEVIEAEDSPKLTPEQLAIKNAMIDLMPSADFVVQDKYKEARRIKEIQESAIKAVENGLKAEDFEEFGKWYHLVLWGDKESPPSITLETIRKNWHTFIEYRKNGGKNGQASVKGGATGANGAVGRKQKTSGSNGIPALDTYSRYEKRANIATGETYWWDSETGERCDPPFGMS